MAHLDEVIKKLAALEAYMNDVKKDVGCLQDYKKRTIEMGMRIEQFEKEHKEFWMMHKDYQKKRVEIENFKKENSELKDGVKNVTERLDNLITVTLVDYPDMKDTYKTIKRAVIIWLVASFLAVVGLTVTFNMVF